MVDGAKMNKKTILDDIYYNLGRQHTDFEIFTLIKQNEEIFSSKHVKYSKAIFPLDFNLLPQSDFINNINNRTICSNEIVLDIENKENIEQIKEKLAKISDCDIFMYDTGSRGIHIHMWYRNPVNDKIKRMLIKIFKSDGLKLTGHPIA